MQDAGDPAASPPDPAAQSTPAQPDINGCLQIRPCRVADASDLPDLRAFLSEADSFFYRYEYNPGQRERKRGVPLFTLPGGVPLTGGAGTCAPALQARPEPAEKKRPKPKDGVMPPADPAAAVWCSASNVGAKPSLGNGSAREGVGTQVGAREGCGGQMGVREGEGTQAGETVAAAKAYVPVPPLAPPASAAVKEELFSAVSIKATPLAERSGGELPPGRLAMDARPPGACAVSVSATIGGQGGVAGSSCATGGVAAADQAASRPSTLVAADSPTGGAQKVKRTHEEKVEALQAKLDRMWPPFTSVSGVHQTEFIGVVPLPGERYAGEGCARCNVKGCDRYGLLFHLKNLMTHSAPRGGQPSKVPSSRTHHAALVGLLGYTPPPAPMPTAEQIKERKRKSKQSTAAGSEEGAEGNPSDAAAAQEPKLAVRGPERKPPPKVPLPSTLTGGGPSRPSDDTRQTPRNHESRNFGGHDGRFIHYRGMRLPFRCGQVLLARRIQLSSNPARNVKFLGNLVGSRSEWEPVLETAQQRAEQSGLVLLLAFRYDELHLSRPGGLDSNHCLHLFNHFRCGSPAPPQPWPPSPPRRSGTSSSIPDPVCAPAS